MTSMGSMSTASSTFSSGVGVATTCHTTPTSSSQSGPRTALASGGLVRGPAP